MRLARSMKSKHKTKVEKKAKVITDGIEILIISSVHGAGVEQLAFRHVW